MGAELPGDRLGSAWQMGGYRKRVLEPHREFIAEWIRQTPHLTLFQLKQELAVRGVKVSHDTVWRFLRGLDPLDRSAW